MNQISKDVWVRSVVATLLVAASFSGAVWAEDEDKKKDEPKAAAAEPAVCQPGTATDQFNTLEDLFAAEAGIELFVGPPAPPGLRRIAQGETVVQWRIVQPD